MIASSDPTPAPSAPLHGVAQLAHLGVIRVQGEDAAKFIHGQLTQDFSLMGLQQARLAAFCSAKGRMQASFIGVKRSDGDILLVCSRDILPTTLKRLSMFVLRAKARLSDATAEFVLCGLAGDATKVIAADAHSIWASSEIDNQTVVQLYPACGVARQLWMAPVGTPLPSGAGLSLADWQWGEVRSGIATVSLPVVELFVPQMLNYESVGGVNFKKGCYPGQEVVARSQFRGTLKRRAYLVHAAQALAAGEEVFDPQDTEQPVGTVVQAAASPMGGWDAIVSMQVSAGEGCVLQVGITDARELQVLPLPYALLDDI